MGGTVVNFDKAERVRVSIVPLVGVVGERVACYG
jgi:hypothetical protein